MLVVIVLGIDTLPYEVLLTLSSSSLISSLLSSTTLSSSTPITVLYVILYSLLQMHKGGGSKRGCLHLLSSFLVKDPIYLPTCSCARPSTIAKASSPSCRGSSTSSPTSMPLLCASSSFEVAHLSIANGIRLHLLKPYYHFFWYLHLDTLLLMPRLFINLSSYFLLSSTTLSFALPPSVVSFLFILGQTPRISPLSTFFPLLYYAFLLSSTLLAYHESPSLSFSSRSILSSLHLNIFWILSADPYPLSLLPLLFIPPNARVFTHPPQ
jgi:hypothetical protein